MTDTAFMLAVLGLAIGAILLGCCYWVWLDAKERAIQRQQDAAMADAYVRAHRHDDRHTHEQIGRPE